jgi:hypothetical protein
MNANDLDQRLLGLGFTVKRGTLRSWAAQGIITGPRRYFRDKPAGQGRYAGRMADWPEATVEDVAAYLTLKEWQLRQPRKRGEKLVLLKPWMPLLRDQVKSWYETPFWCTGLHGMAYSKELQDYLSDAGVHCYIMDFTFGFFFSWLPTIEKVRHNWPLEKPATIVYVWDIPPEKFKPVMTLEEAQQLQLPAMHPNVQIYNSTEDSLAWNGKMEISDNAEWKRVNAVSFGKYGLRRRIGLRKR